jgi:hypothetical protein
MASDEIVLLRESDLGVELTEPPQVLVASPFGMGYSVSKYTIHGATIGSGYGYSGCISNLDGISILNGPFTFYAYSGSMYQTESTGIRSGQSESIGMLSVGSLSTENERLPLPNSSSSQVGSASGFEDTGDFKSWSHFR